MVFDCYLLFRKTLAFPGPFDDLVPLFRAICLFVCLYLAHGVLLEAFPICQGILFGKAFAGTAFTNPRHGGS